MLLFMSYYKFLFLPRCIYACASILFCLKSYIFFLICVICLPIWYQSCVTTFSRYSYVVTLSSVQLFWSSLRCSFTIKTFVLFMFTSTHMFSISLVHVFSNFRFCFWSLLLVPHPLRIRGSCAHYSFEVFMFFCYLFDNLVRYNDESKGLKLSPCFIFLFILNSFNLCPPTCTFAMIAVICMFLFIWYFHLIQYSPYFNSFNCIELILNL